MLFDPSSHEPVTGRPWDDRRARAAIAAVVAETEGAFDEGSLWACHGTAGNGYAFLKLFERTGDELWLERARGFAMHAIEQLERTTATYGRGRHTLWTGDPGTALYLHACLTATTAFPTLDHF